MLKPRLEVLEKSRKRSLIHKILLLSFFEHRLGRHNDTKTYFCFNHYRTIKLTDRYITSQKTVNRRQLRKRNTFCFRDIIIACGRHSVEFVKSVYQVAQALSNIYKLVKTWMHFMNAQPGNHRSSEMPWRVNWHLPCVITMH